MKPRLIVEQKITAFANKYKIFALHPDGTKAGLIAFAQQKRLAFKEKVSFYSEEAKQNLIFTFRAEKVMDIHGKYFVEDAQGKQIGVFKKDFQKSFVKSTWHLLGDNEETILTVSESNQTLAVIRRYGTYIPVVGDIIELIAAFFKYHFVFQKPDSQEVLGIYIKTTLFRDHYRLELTDDAYQQCDWRLLASIAVALDALQSR